MQWLKLHLIHILKQTLYQKGLNVSIHDVATTMNSPQYVWVPFYKAFVYKLIIIFF